MAATWNMTLRRSLWDAWEGNKERPMTKIIQSVAAGAAVVLTLAASASAAPLFNQGNSVVQPSLTENVRLVCNEDGRCYRTRGPRYVERRYYGDSYAYGPRAYVDPGYGYGGPSYYGGPGYYGGGPSIGFSFGTGRRW